MKNDINPFEIKMSIKDALEKGLQQLGGLEVGLIVYHNFKHTEFTILNILNITDSLCIVNNVYSIETNTNLFIPIKVVLYDEVKSLKFIEQIKLFKDGE